MDKDHWPNLYEDKYAIKRIKRSVDISNLKEGMSVLDVGCHKGELNKYLPDHISYTGIDYLNGYEIDGGFNLFKKFDRIFCLETLEHLKYPRKTLYSIVKSLNDDGLAIISLPNEVTILHRIRGLFGVMDGEAFGEEGKHLHLPSIKQSRNFISSEFKILEEYYYYSTCSEGSRNKITLKLASLVPEIILELSCFLFPSLFARGTIFVCYKK